MDDELLDLVDKNDRPVGTINRSDLESLFDETKKRYLRSSCALIRSDEGKYWTPRRVASKKIAPNGLDFAMAEHMGGGETYIAAAIRGFAEELNQQIQPDDLRLVGILGPQLQLQLPYFSAIYIYESNDEPDYSRQDFVGGEWLEAQQIIDMVANGEPANEEGNENGEYHQKEQAVVDNR